MLYNNIKIAFRNLWRSRQFSFINIGGLALGITVFLFIMQFVAAEWSANRYNKNFNTLYRVNLQAANGNTDYYLPPGFAPVVKKEIQGIANYTRVADGIAGGVLTYQGANNEAPKIFRENSMIYADASFLEMFSFPLKAGAASLALPNTVAISTGMSQKLFGKENSIGNLITVSNQFGNTMYKVSAVYEQPVFSDIAAEVILSLHTLESAANRDDNDWADPNGMESGFVNIYFQLQDPGAGKTVGDNITQLVRNLNPDSKEDLVVLQPFKNLHLAPTFDYPYQTFGSLLLVVVFFAVAVLILLIAWVNYINLSTAQALNRTKEVGIRKVLGASRIQLSLQYLAETLLLTLFSVMIAVLLVTLFQNSFNQFTAKPLSLAVLNQSWFWLGAITLILLGSLFSGGYVAIAITSFKPVNSIRANAGKINRGFSLRKGLVVFQFTISIAFIIATIILYNQLQFMKTESLGMNLQQLLVVQGPTVSSEGQAAKNVSFKNALAQLPFVKKYAASNNVPGIGYNFSTNGITNLSPKKDDERKSYSMFICDEHFFDTYGISFTQGKAFTNNDAERSWNNVKKVILNEKAAQQLGFDTRENIIGKKIKWDDNYEVIGIVKDYHHLSLREAIQPTIYLGSVSFSFFTVQTDANNMQSKIQQLKSIYTAAFPGNPFEYFFADEKYGQQYVTEQKLGNVFIAAALIAILIACLGLYGLSAFSARQRIKEIGIRKVLGASVYSITSLLSKDFIRLVIAAIVIASPIAWWGMQKWLQDFAYRTHISWWIFLAAGAVAVFIAMATISIQAVKAARTNPVKNLRTE